MSGEHYTVIEFAKKLKKHPEHVRQMCRQKYRLPEPYKAYLDESRRWHIVSKDYQDEPPISPLESHKSLSKQLVLLWDAIDIQSVWEKNTQRDEEFEFDAESFFLQLSRLYLTAKKTKHPRTVEATIKLNSNGRFVFESVRDPFLMEYYLHQDRYRQLVKLWRCILGNTSTLNGKRYFPYVPGEEVIFLEQFEHLKICLNCGQLKPDDVQKTLYCHVDCGDRFRKWWKSVREMSPPDQIKSVCRRIRNLEK